MSSRFREWQSHRLFRFSLWVKLGFAVSEMVGAIMVYWVPRDLLVQLVIRFTGFELSRDSHDIVANYLRHAVYQFAEVRYFAAWYLLAHGVVKLWLIAGLLHERIEYYRPALLVFGLFVIYQTYRFGLTHSWILPVITLLDLFVMGLLWKEYRLALKRR